jgi:hypothetical protein
MAATHLLDRSTSLFEAAVERYPAALVGATGAVSTSVLGVVQGLDATTIAASGLLTVTVALVTLVVRVLLADIRGLRARVATLEEREDERLRAVVADNADLIARIRDLEDRLRGDGR